MRRELFLFRVFFTNVSLKNKPGSMLSDFNQLFCGTDEKEIRDKIEKHFKNYDFEFQIVREKNGRTETVG